MTNEMEQKRAYVSALYPGKRWRRRVRRMPDSQVVAIFLREKNKESDKPKDPPADPPKEKPDDIPF